MKRPIAKEHYSIIDEEYIDVEDVYAWNESGEELKKFVKEKCPHIIEFKFKEIKV
jgi:hypothetical protein